MKRLISLFLALALLLCPMTARATGNGNMDAGGGGMGQGTSQNKWSPGNDGVRITVIDAENGTAVSTPMDFSNRVQSFNVLHFGKVSKLQYLNDASLQLASGTGYSCIQPASAIPTIVSATGRNGIESIKRYFCSEYACMMVAEAAGMDYASTTSGRYRLMLEPIAYFTSRAPITCPANGSSLSCSADRPFLSCKNRHQHDRSGALRQGNRGIMGQGPRYAAKVP